MDSIAVFMLGFLCGMLVAFKITSNLIEEKIKYNNEVLRTIINKEIKTDDEINQTKN